MRADEERRALRARLMQARKTEAVGLLASGVAHDFNNILTVISGQCHLVLSQAGLDAGGRKRIEEIDRAAEHVLQDRPSDRRGEIGGHAERLPPMMPGAVPGGGYYRPS
jgi:hypothetical protein